jgi:ATP synthase protein I
MLHRDLASFAASVESMPDNARERDSRVQPSADEAAFTARLNRLGERLRQVTPDIVSDRPPAPPTSDPSAIARGFRLSTELVAGVLVGAALGWALDHWLGTSPWGMILFLLLGFAAGVLNVMRSAGVIASKTLEPPDSKA